MSGSVTASAAQGKGDKTGVEGSVGSTSDQGIRKGPLEKGPEQRRKEMRE